MEDYNHHTFTESDFSVGMRVICVRDHPDGNEHITAGHTGTIKSIISESFRPLGIEWDHNCGGHDLNGECRRSHGWFCPVGYIAPLETVIDESYDDCELSDIAELIGV